MVPDFIWASDFFGPQEIWSPRNLAPEKFGPRMRIIIWPDPAFSCRDQVSWGPNLSETKFCGAQISRGPKKSGAQTN